MIWVEVTTASILAHMPTDVLTRYNAWLVTYPDRATRLATLTANAIREFRDALKSNPANLVHATETYLPQSCIRHCENIVLFTLAMEMGLNMDNAGESARVSADVFLRQIPYGKWNATTEDVSPTPHFSTAAQSTETTGRTIQWALAFMLAARLAFGGWIENTDGVIDTGVATTFMPNNYSITVQNLANHLYGINVALGTKATTNYVDNAIATATSGVVDATARTLAESASITANAALNSLAGYVRLDDSTGTLSRLRVDANLFGHDAGVGSGGGTNNFYAGHLAGFNATGSWNTAVGPFAGYGIRGSNDGWTAIGNHAGENSENLNSGRWTAIGTHAGEESTNASSLVMGNYAGYRSYMDVSMVFGPYAGFKSYINDGVVEGYYAGSNSWSLSGIAIGDNAGACSSGSFNTVIGYRSGQNATGNYITAIGPCAGTNAYLNDSIAIGNRSGANSTNLTGIMIGNGAGILSSGSYNQFIGFNAGQNATGRYITAVGPSAGYLMAGGSNDGWTAVGYHAGYKATSFGPEGNNGRGIFIGSHAGEESTNNLSISLGSFCGYRSILQYSSAIGCNAGQYSQLTNAIALGNFVGLYACESNSIFMDVFPRNLGSGYAASNAIIYAHDGNLSLGRGAVTNADAMAGTNHLRGLWTMGNLWELYLTDQELGGTNRVLGMSKTAADGWTVAGRADFAGAMASWDAAATNGGATNVVAPASLGGLAGSYNAATRTLTMPGIEGISTSNGCFYVKSTNDGGSPHIKLWADAPGEYVGLDVDTSGNLEWNGHPLIDYGGTIGSFPLAGEISLLTTTNVIVTGESYAYEAFPSNAYTISVSTNARRYVYSVTVISTNSCTFPTNYFLRGSWTPGATNELTFKPYTNGGWWVMGAAK